MAAADRGPSWTDGLRVEEKRLQEYLWQKQQTLLLKGAAETMKHTLQNLPTTHADDGVLHFGDSLMLRNSCTGGLLQADIGDQVPVSDGLRSDAVGVPLSTGTMIAACPRNVFTLSRVHDDDGASDSYVHYGQVIRLGTSPLLQERPLYLYASGGGAEGHDLADGETLMCLYPRASAGTHWRVLSADPAEGQADVRGQPILGGTVALGAHVMLQGVASGHSLSSDEGLRMTTYGNEWRVFGRGAAAGPDGDAALSTTWSFVDMQWAEGVVAAARREPVSGVADPGELLQNPARRAEHDLRVLESEGGAAVYRVLERVYPMIRGAGMHVVRRLRSMCAIADTEGRGCLPLHSFQGVLSWKAIRFKEDETAQLLQLFEFEPGSSLIDYRRFFALMAPSMPSLRRDVVRDAYTKLEGLAAGGIVQVDDLQRNWNAGCHPDVQKGLISESEARTDFLRQWDVTSADGLVSFEEFLDYYSDVSTAVESNEHFVELVRCGWRL